MTDYTNLIARLRGLSSAARNPLIVADPLEHAADDALAAIAALQAQVREMALDVLAASGQAQEARAEAAEAQIAALTARVEGLTGALRWAHDTLWEINPSNYDHDDVCKLNDASVEVILGIAPLIGETHGKSPEWWAARAALSATTEEGHDPQA